MNFFEKVYEQVKQIPRGRVASYRQIALMCGAPNNARQVGWALHVNPDPANIPCHRVVTKCGKVSQAFAFGGENAQIKLLAREGIKFDIHGLVKKEFFIN